MNGTDKTKIQGMAKIIIYQDSQKKWRWNITARNGNIIATSGEGYERVDGCFKGLDATAAAFGVEKTENYRYGTIVTKGEKSVRKQKNRA